MLKAFKIIGFVCLCAASGVFLGAVLYVNVIGPIVSHDPPVAEYPCGPKVLIFHAKWCQFCPTTEQINQLQTDYPGCEIVDVDVDKHPDLADEYHVKNIPRFFVLSEGAKAKMTTNMVELKRWLKDYAKAN